VLESELEEEPETEIHLEKFQNGLTKFKEDEELDTLVSEISDEKSKEEDQPSIVNFSIEKSSVEEIDDEYLELKEENDSMRKELETLLAQLS